MSANKKLSKDTLIYVYNEVLVTLITGDDPDTRNDMDEYWEHFLSEIHKTQK